MLYSLAEVVADVSAQHKVQQLCERSAGARWAAWHSAASRPSSAWRGSQRVCQELKAGGVNGRCLQPIGKLDCRLQVKGL